MPYTLSAFRILPGGGAGGGGPCMQDFVSYIPPSPFEFCQEKLTVMQVQGLKGLRMYHQPRTLNP